jgi:hypothetical protein
MTRERLTYIELTESEVLLNAQSLYLAQILINHPERIQDDRRGMKCALAILSDIPLWENYCTKMMNAITKSMTTEYV